MPFASTTLGSEQPLLNSELLVYGRDPLAPVKDAVTADGDVVVPIANAILGSEIAAAVDLSTMMTLTAWFMGLYMGGHTLKDLAVKWTARS